MKGAIIYARVSTTEQADRGLSLGAQLDRCMEYCRAHGLDVIDTVVDAVSAKDIDHRPGFKRIVAMIHRREMGHIVTWRLDRFSRNTTDTLYFVSLMGKKDIELHVVNEQGTVRSDSADSEFLLTLKAGLATRERKLIGERTSLALARKREKAEYCGGEPPYGFREEGGALLADMEEQRVISKVRKLRGQGYSIRRIVRCLLEDGHLTRRGTPFQKTQVERILAREAA